MAQVVRWRRASSQRLVADGRKLIPISNSETTMSNSLDAKPASTTSMALILCAVLVIVVIQVGTGTVVYLALPNWDARGNFGSMFDVVGALFSGLALAGVVYAILLQREELGLQRQELELTRAELARAAKAQEDSATLVQRQLALAESTKREQDRLRRSHVGARLSSLGARVDRDGERIALDVTNNGGAMRGLGVTDFEPANAMHLAPADYVATGARLEIVGVFGTKSDRLRCWVQYFDADANLRGLQVE